MNVLSGFSIPFNTQDFAVFTNISAIRLYDVYLRVILTAIYVSFNY
jgi:hypothetical protein